MWKIERDPYYAPLYRRYGYAFITEAGFFPDDEVDPNFVSFADFSQSPSIDAITCDLEKIRAGFAEYRRFISEHQLHTDSYQPVVVLSTGALCPPHAGHRAMLLAAMDFLRTAKNQKNGFYPIGGLLSPGHDAYIKAKCGDTAILIDDRLRLCRDLLKDDTFCSVDSWESLHCRVAVNFTDVVYRTEKMLQHHIDPSIRVVYVCGADNARFALTFLEQGLCIVAGRPTYEEHWRGYQEKISSMSSISHETRIFWAPLDHPASSSAIRNSIYNHTQNNIHHHATTLIPSS